MHVVLLDRVDSTSLLARRELSSRDTNAHEPLLYIAHEQTGGVGQQGRAWWSPPGGAWFTLVVRRATRPEPEIALRVGEVIADWVAGLVVAKVTVKHPNDVLLDGRKVAGVLIEVVPVETGFAVLVGVGVNLHNRVADAPAEVAARATSVLEAVGEAPEPQAVAIMLAERIVPLVS